MGETGWVWGRVKFCGLSGGEGRGENGEGEGENGEMHTGQGRGQGQGQHLGPVGKLETVGGGAHRDGDGNELVSRKIA